MSKVLVDRDRVVESMCLTWRHDFGLDKLEGCDFCSGMTDKERDHLRGQMGKLFDHHFAPALSAVTAERDRLAAALSAPDTIKAEPAGDYANLRKQFMSLNALANSNAKMVKYWRDQCGRETRETLLANAANVNAERDTNALLTDSLEAAEAERDRLRAKVERYVPLHEAIQRAAGELPEGWAIQLYIERNGGGVELIGPDGTVDFATNNERLDYTVIDALEAAMAAKEA